MTQTLRWHIILTKASGEWQAHKEILRKGLRCYYPFYFADVRRGRYFQGAVKPQFPGYLFVGLEPGESIEQARYCQGVRDFVRDGGGLVSISDAQMQRCRADCDQRYWDSLPRRIERMPVRIGDFVAIPHGAFAGMPCEVLSIDKSGRISASLGNLEVSFHVTDVHQSVRARAEPSEIQLLKAS